MKLDATLKTIGFQQSTHKGTVYRRGKRSFAMLISIYINDLVITDTMEEEVEAFKAEMKIVF